MNERDAVRLATDYFKALELRAPSGAPTVTPIPVGAYAVRWPDWELVVANGRVMSLRRLSVTLLASSENAPTTPRQKERAKRLAHNLQLPSDARLTVCTEKEIVWERPGPGGYPIYQKERFGLTYKVQFDSKSGQPCFAADSIRRLQGAVAPPIRVSAQAALKQAQELVRKARGPKEAPAGPAVLTWAPGEERITPDIAANRLRNVARTSFPRGAWQLVWLVSWKGFSVGIDPVSGVPAHFYCWMRYDLT
ncbi:MAG: hypothetical protein QM758_01995 [Armatimonas sp.]